MSEFAACNRVHGCVRKLLAILLLASVAPSALSQAQSAGVSVPLMLAPHPERQGFVRVINKTGQAGMVRITAVDDGGTAAEPIEIQLAANQALHFNSEDLANGNAAKGIARIGEPGRGHWRLSVETALADVRVLAFVRTRDGFLTAMHDTLPRDSQGRILAEMVNPGSNSIQASKLRLVNTGANSERVSIAGVDDRGASAGPVTLTLAAGQSRTLSAFDLENGASGLTGRLGDGTGKWHLTVTAGQSVVGMSLLETPGGPITNLSTAGVPAAAMTETPTGDGFANATNLAVDGRQSGRIDPAGESDYFRVRVSESGTLTVYTTGNLDTRGYLYDSNERQLASNDDGGANDGTNFRIQRAVDAGTYYVRVEAYLRTATGDYTVHAELEASTDEPTDPPTDPESPGYSSIYFESPNSSGDFTGRWGAAFDYSTLNAADEAANELCGRPSCEKAYTPISGSYSFPGDCFAFAVSRNSVFRRASENDRPYYSSELLGLDQYQQRDRGLSKSQTLKYLESTAIERCNQVWLHYDDTPDCAIAVASNGTPISHCNSGQR